MEAFGWCCFRVDGDPIIQFPDENTDNTKLLHEVILKEMKNVKQFHVAGISPQTGVLHRIGIDLTERYFIVGEMIIPFYSDDEDLKLVYFLTRQVTANASEEEGEIIYQELPRMHTIGYEDKNGKMFLSVQEYDGAFAISNCNP
jgi:hypothetical protein